MAATITAKPVMRPKRMSLDAITDGPRPEPWVMLVYGPEGVGKSSLVLDIDDHITIDIEQSANQLKTKKFPTPLTLQDVYDAIEALYTGDHQYKTVVIDTIDRLEAMIFKGIAERAKLKSVEDFGYGKGYQVALDEWRNIMARLDELRASRRMNVLLLGHTFIKAFKNPDGPDYDRYTLRLHEKASGFIKEWAEAVLFARYDEATAKLNDRDAKVKGVSSGERSLWTRHTAAYDAKNRFNLPETLPLKWRELEAAMREGVKKEIP